MFEASSPCDLHLLIQQYAKPAQSYEQTNTSLNHFGATRVAQAVVLSTALEVGLAETRRTATSYAAALMAALEVSIIKELRSFQPKTSLRNLDSMHKEHLVEKLPALHYAGNVAGAYPPSIRRGVCVAGAGARAADTGREDRAAGQDRRTAAGQPGGHLDGALQEQRR